mmetsp:Transcript_21137/g.53240  ORF Transcript_21137/g.53240 Transcript_21137/m.53240 type:complete len:501 (-) Transcript_21137:434-1936(-)
MLNRVHRSLAHDFQAMQRTPVEAEGGSAEEPLCFVDRCPHRRAPLSDGALTEDGTVMCSYHGWRFDREGSATIPKMGAGDSRACATALPAVVFHGLVFVWPSPREAGQGPPPEELLPAIPGAAKGDAVRNSVFRDMPGVDMPLLLENILDPDHGEYAHQIQMFEPFTFLEGVKSNVDIDYFPARGGGGTSTVPRRVSFSQPWGDDGEEVSITYTAPGFVEWRRPAGMGGLAGSIYFWVVPLGVGRVRFLSCHTMFPSRTAPRWLLHLFLNKFLDEDTALLASQNAHMLGAEAAAYASGDEGAARSVRARTYRIRSPSDRLLVGAGRFLDATLPDQPNRRALLAAAGGPSELATVLPGAEEARRAVLDRMATHVASCPTCQTAVAKFSRYRTWLVAAAGVLGAAAALGVVAGVASASAAATTAGASLAASLAGAGRGWLLAAVLCGALAAACAAGAAKLGGLVRSITGYEYTRRHYQKDLQKIPGVLKVPLNLKWAAHFER